MPTTDRRACLCCRECGAEIDAETAARNLRYGMRFCDVCFATVPRAVREGWIIAHPKLTPAEIGIGKAIGLRYQQKCRAEQRARRLAITQRRQRIASTPRVGDVAIFGDVRCQVFRHGWETVPCRLFRDAYGHIGVLILTEREWREAVRRARVTQEGQLWPTV